jgi:glutathione S-transferase
MMILYHCVGARSFRPLWTLEELGLPYELKVLPFPPRATAREYLAVNPLGTVPAFFDGSMRMTESAAICQYLTARHGDGSLQISPSEEDFGPFLNWLHFGEATLTFPQTLVLRYRHFETPERRQPQVAEDYQRWFLARLRGIDAVVGKQEFLCGGRFTVADISVGYALMLAETIGIAPEFSPAVQAYWERLATRDGYRRSLDAERRFAIAQGIDPVPAPLAGR